MAQTDAGGRYPAGPGWFVLNVADSAAIESDMGQAALFDGTFSGGERFTAFGINVRVLEPGQAAAVYHREHHQETFLVLFGECVLIVEDEERRLRQWDLFYSPPGTAHVVVGAGDGPCAVLMVGGRGGDTSFFYPASEAAGRYGAAVASDTSDPAVAYSGITPPTQGRLTWPPTKSS